MSRRQPKVGFRPALQRHPVDRAMYCLPTWSPSIFRVATWRFIGGRFRAWAALTPNTAKQVMMSIFAGEFSRLGGSLPSVRPRSCGTIGVLRFGLFLGSRTVTAKQNHCCVLNI